MSWYDDHLNAVADRFAKRYVKAQNKAQFIHTARKELLRMGWSEQEVDRIIKRIEHKTVKEAKE